MFLIRISRKYSSKPLIVQFFVSLPKQNTLKMKIGICNDHAGVDYKFKLVRMLRNRGIEVVNFGTDTTDSVDYPDFAHKLAEAVESGAVDKGIALCGTGNGMAMTLNKHQGIRAGLAWGSAIGKLVSQHNNANVLVLPARFISYAMASATVRAWLETPFEGGRHLKRIDKIPCK
jgi:ribose 5-phosphate isomerase B